MVGLEQSIVAKRQTQVLRASVRALTLVLKDRWETQGGTESTHEVLYFCKQ